MNWDAIGATGEWAGAIAVVATLLYLGTQIRHSNRQSQAAARYSFLDAYGQITSAMAQSKDASAVYRRGLAGEALDDDEAMQFQEIIAHWLNTWSVMYDLYQEGQLPDNQWFLVRKDILSLFSTTGGRELWDSVAKQGLQPSFVFAVEVLLESEEASYDILRNLSPKNGLVEP